MSAIPELRTERLVLRAPGAEDAAIYAEFYRDRSGSGNYGGPLRPDQAWKRLAENLGHWQLRGYGLWMIQPVGAERAVGGCGLWHPGGWPSHELTWWLMPEARGTGYATEASRAAIAFGYDRLGWERVETHMRDENAPARRLAERLGGRVIRRDVFPDGVTRDVFHLPHSAAEEREAAK